MGTKAIVFANCLLIIKVVTGAIDADDTRLPEQQPPDDNNQPEAANKMYNLIQGNKPEEGDLKVAENLDDVANTNKIRLSLLPSQKDTMIGTGNEDNLKDNNFGGYPQESYSMDINNFSGLGSLNTNEIVKPPGSLLKMDSFSGLNNKDESNIETSKETGLEASKYYNHPGLDKAVENAVNNLPSSDESPLVPLIKLFNRGIDEIPTDENISPEELTRKRASNKIIVLKLAKLAQQQKEKTDIPTTDQTPEKSIVQDRPQEGKTTEVENEDEYNNELCDCEGGCEEETLQDQTEPENSGFDEKIENQTDPEKDVLHEETQKDQIEPEDNECDGSIVVFRSNIEKNDNSENTQVQTEREKMNQSEDDDKQTNNKPQKVLAHIEVRLRSSGTEDKRGGQSPLITTHPFLQNEQLIPRENSHLINIFTRMSKTSFPNYRRQNIDIPTFPAVISNIIEDGSRINRSPFKVSDLDSDFTNINESMFNPFPHKESLLLQALVNMAMKRMAAIPAFRERHENQFLSTPFFEQNPNSPSLSSRRVIIIKPRNELTSPHLQLQLPFKSSEYKVKHLEDFRGNPIFKQLHPFDLEDGRELTMKPNFKFFNDVQDNSSSDDFAQHMSSSQDMPWFIKNILTNLRNAGHGTPLQPDTMPFTPLQPDTMPFTPLQPDTMPFTPLQKPSEEKNPALIRALLAPFAL